MRAYMQMRISFLYASPVLAPPPHTHSFVDVEDIGRNGSATEWLRRVSGSSS